MRRTVKARIEVDLHDSTDLTFAIAAAAGAPLESERLRFELDGAAVDATELVEAPGTRLHALTTGPGVLVATYEAVAAGSAPAPEVAPLDRIVYTRPSRYCQSDVLTPVARELFGDLRGLDLLLAARNWVNGRTAYVSGSSSGTTGALDTFLARQGVCRDFAHLLIAVLRALDVPARLVSVFAPGLSPMDFHAVVEAMVDGTWFLLDATGLAPRRSMLRIATGRDAADTAFLTNTLADLDFRSLTVLAIVDALPADDPAEPVQLG
jgi:transglutaminase-like putative cysteine protease